MEECTNAAKAALTSQLKVEVCCACATDETGTREVINVINRVFLDKASKLNDAEI